MRFVISQQGISRTLQGSFLISGSWPDLVYLAQQIVNHSRANDTASGGPVTIPVYEPITHAESSVVLPWEQTDQCPDYNECFGTANED